MNRLRIKSHLAATCACLALAMGAGPALAQASGEEAATEVYFLRFAREVADGRAVVSTSHDTLVGRARVGERSLMLHDLQGGAITVERAGQSRAAPLLSPTRIDASYAYDYRERRAEGDGEGVAVFNEYLRPLIAAGPALGADAEWVVAADLQALGLESQTEAPLTILLSRTYLSHAGEDVVLVEFDIPAFTYRTPEGETVVHWAHGFAVTDTEFAEIFALGTQHRAMATGVDGVMRPVSVRTSLHGIDRAGDWRMDFARAPQVREAVERTMATAGERVHGVTPAADAASLRPYAAVVAARLDLAALALGENGANPMPVALDANVAASPDASPAPSGAGTSSYPILTQRMMSEMVRESHSPGFQGGDASTREATLAGLERDADGRTPLQANLDVYMPPDVYVPFTMNPDEAGFTYRTAEARAAAAGAGGADPSVSQRMQENLEQYLPPGDYTPPTFNPSAPGDTYRTVEVGGETSGGGTSADPSVTTRMQDILDRLTPPGDYTPPRFNPTAPGDTYRTVEAGGAAATPPERNAAGQTPLQANLDVYRPHDDYLPLTFDSEGSGFTYRTAEAREAARRLLADEDGVNGAETARLDALVTAIARAAEAEANRTGVAPRLLPPGQDGADAPPAWMEAGWRQYPELREADDTLYRLLLAEMAREEAEARRDARRAEQRASSGIDSLDAFVTNNAFDYTSMIGVVETDLSRWGEWLATQNVRELERLALLAGYPNLASALTDAHNLIRQAEDEGYRRWALQAPSCSGLAGCGPSYLERWWAKQATVRLGEILADSRDIFSSGGFTDIGVAGLNLVYLLRDHGVEDGDIVRVRISQFGRPVYEGEVALTNAGQLFSELLQRGVASVEILALNEGTAIPNTAQINLNNVVRGQAIQTYSLSTGETATLRIEIGVPGN